MDFDTFNTEFLHQLKLKNKKCLNLIENNKELIQENLGNVINLETIINFVDEINNIILENNNNNNLISIIIVDDINPFISKYEVIEKVLKHPYFNRVLEIFQQSDVLIRACKEGNKNAAKWLLTMEISPYTQDENGISALMYAAQQNFDFVIKPFFFDSLCMNLEDNNGENVLYHCVRNPKFIEEDLVTGNRFQIDLIYNSELYINHTNHKGESILVYCIKNNIIEPINKFLLYNRKIDVNIADNEGKTAAMYLTEKGLFPELLELHRKNCNYDYTDMNGESAMSILINKLYSERTEDDVIPYENYVRIMNIFVNYQCDFNYPIDKDENTPFMIMLIVNDITTAKFCARYIKKLDLSVKNKYGENATSLCYKLNQENHLLPFFRKNPTYDTYYRDPLYQNTLLMFSVINNTASMKELLENDPEMINEVNIKNENALIIASKINNIKAATILLKRGIDINHQDNLGNTALHYAIEIESPLLIHNLMSKKPDIHIKNYEGKSPLDLANEIGENKEEIVNMLLNPSYDIENIKFNNMVSSKYEEEIQSYIMPCANNDYSEFKSTSAMENIKRIIYDSDEEYNNNYWIILFLLFIPVLILLNVDTNE